MANKQIKLFESYIDKQTDYFQSYIKIQDYIKQDISNDNLDDLEAHIFAENLIIAKIIRMSKIIENAVFDFKIKSIEKNSILFQKQVVLEELKDRAIKNSFKNSEFLKDRKTQFENSYKEPPIKIPDNYYRNEAPSFVDVQI